MIGVTTWAGLSWEKGKFRPKGEKKAALVALRKVEKRDVKKLLAEITASKVKAKEGRPEVRMRKKKPGKRVIRRRK